MKFIGRNIFKLKSSFHGDVDYGDLKHIAVDTVELLHAHEDDNSVAEQTNIVIPANAVVTSVMVGVKMQSNRPTALYNVQFSATSGTAADSGISSGTELLGAGASGTISTDSASAQDIDVRNDVNEIWYNNTVVRMPTAAQYIYVCNAGTGNGTTNPSKGRIQVVIEYMAVSSTY